MVLSTQLFLVFLSRLESFRVGFTAVSIVCSRGGLSPRNNWGDKRQLIAQNG